MLVQAFTFTTGMTLNTACMFRQPIYPTNTITAGNMWGGLMNLGTAAPVNGGSNSRALFFFTSAGLIQFAPYENNTLTTTGTHDVCDGNWHWIEMQVVLTSAATGSVTVYVDGELDLQLTGISTMLSLLDKPYGTIGFGAVANLGQKAVTSCYDDFIVWDNTGDTFNTFPIGQKRIYTGKPSGAGSSSQFTPSSGSNYAIAAQGYSGSGILTASVPGKLDLYSTNILNGANPVDIDAVVLNTYAKNAGSTGAGFLTPTLQSNGVTQAGSRIQVTASPVNYRSTFLVDANGNPWSKASIDALQFGVESGYGN
jgi:hypothetical protein